MKRWERILAILLTLTFLASAVLLLVLGRQVHAGTTNPSSNVQAVYAQHQRHLPPNKGSGLYQYDHPGHRRFDAAQVYDPVLPPPTPAKNGVREFELVLEENVLHEVAPGVKVPSWTFNRTVPGPVLRATEGDLVRVKFVNKGTLPHTIHFHGIHPAKMDGVFELVPPGGSYT
ncbi:MAG: multicopper oxidase domain-containing protein, partial [Terriglobales bacterium]